MFKRKVKIKSLSCAITGDLLFTVGIGSDGNAYIWNSTLCKWLLHQATPPQEQPNASA